MNSTIETSATCGVVRLPIIKPVGGYAAARVRSSLSTAVAGPAVHDAQAFAEVSASPGEEPL